MKMQMRDLLECRFADGVPNAQTFGRKCGRDPTSDLRQRLHQRGSSICGNATNIRDMFPRDDQRMAAMKLPEIDERHGQVVCVNDAGRQPASNNLTKDTGSLSAHEIEGNNKTACLVRLVMASPCARGRTQALPALLCHLDLQRGTACTSFLLRRVFRVRRG